MERFNPQLLVQKNGKLQTELFPPPGKQHAFLLWKISISLQDFVLADYPIVNSMIELGSFPLPYFSLLSNNQYLPQLKSWKELPGKKFDFRSSHGDNMGSIFYNIPYRFLGEEYAEEEGAHFFDNIVDIQEVQFGELSGSTIHAKVCLRIDFDSFNMHDPPFRKDLFCEIFEMNAKLEIEDVTLQVGVKELSVFEAMAIGSQALNIDDYELISLRRAVYVNAKDMKEQTIHSFRPKFRNGVEL